MRRRILLLSTAIVAVLTAACVSTTAPTAPGAPAAEVPAPEGTPASANLVNTRLAPSNAN